MVREMTAKTIPFCIHPHTTALCLFSQDDSQGKQKISQLSGYVLTSKIIRYSPNRTGKTLNFFLLFTESLSHLL